MNRPAPASPSRATPNPRRTGALGQAREICGTAVGGGATWGWGGGVAARVCRADAGVRRVAAADFFFAEAGLVGLGDPFFAAVVFFADVFLTEVFFAGVFRAGVFLAGVFFADPERGFRVDDARAGPETAGLTAGRPRSR